MLFSTPGVDHSFLTRLSAKIQRTSDTDQEQGQCGNSQFELLGQTNLLAVSSNAVAQSVCSAVQTTPGCKSARFVNTSCVHEARILTLPPYVPAPSRDIHPCIQCKSEMLLPNDLVGCIIGRGGTKINEIRQTSQASIKISSGEDGVVERRITITGTRSAVQMAKTLISNSIELHKHLLALNLAMNSLYENHVSDGENFIPWGTTDKGSQNELLLSSHPWDWTNYPHITNSEIIPFGNCSAIRNAEMQYKHAATSGSTSASATPSLNPPDRSVLQNRAMARVSKLDHSCIVPGSATAHILSAAEPKAADTANQRQILELIGQLPLTNQKRWLAAFGLENVVIDG